MTARIFKMIEAPVYQGEKLLPADQGGEHQRCLS